MNKGFLQRRLVQPIIDLLRQGITPEKIALSVAFGIALGVFPVIGSTTLLCTLAAIIFRLNLPAIQLINYFMYPLQIILVIPFIRLGERLFGASHLALTIGEMYSIIRAGIWHAIITLWTPTWHAMIAWLVVGPLSIWLLYRILTPVMHRLNQLRQAGMDAISARVQ